MGQEEITSSAKKYFEENEKEYTNNAMLSHFSCVQLFVILRAVAHQATLSMGFSRQEYWSGLPCPP